MCRGDMTVPLFGWEPVEPPHNRFLATSLDASLLKLYRGRFCVNISEKQSITIAVCAVYGLE